MSLPCFASWMHYLDRTMSAFEADVFSPAPRKTADDVSGNNRSLNRALDSTLYLIVKPKGSSKYTLPEETSADASEPLRKVSPEPWMGSRLDNRQTAERALSLCIGDSAKTYFISNTPSAVQV